MTANQLQYWRNVETERANRAQESTLESEIKSNLARTALDYAQANLSRRKYETEALEQSLKQWEIARQNTLNQKLIQEYLQAVQSTKQSEMDTYLQSKQLPGQLYEASLGEAKYRDYKQGDINFVAAMQEAGRVLDALGVGLGFKI